MEHDLISELEPALFRLDASDYGVWIAGGAALYPLGDAGFRLWICWSQTSSSYRERDAVRKWQSFRNSRSHPKAIFGYARKAGWRPSGSPHKPFSASSPAIPPPAPRTTTERPITAHLARLCDEALTLDHPDAEPARRYLDHRNIGAIVEDLPGNMRFHPRLSYRDPVQGVTHQPAIVARIEDAGGQLVGIHRTYLTPDGRKAPVASPKKILGKMPPGSRIELYRWLPGHPMAVAEGLETALAIRIADFVNVWCVVSAHGMASFMPPEGVSRLGVYADRDKSEAGIKAARKLQQRMAAAGIPCRVLEPSDEQVRAVTALRGPVKGVDWLDVFAAEGAL